MKPPRLRITTSESQPLLASPGTSEPRTKTVFVSVTYSWQSSMAQRSIQDTAAEIGFAVGIGKRCYGLRTDWRDCGDYVGLPVNLQVLHFIEKSGGKLFRRIEEIEF